MNRLLNSNVGSKAIFVVLFIRDSIRDVTLGMRILRRVLIVLVASVLVVMQQEPTGRNATQSLAASDIPRIATSQEAIHLVRVHGQGRCSGVALRGPYVVTAAHCVLDRYTGKFTSVYDVRVEYDNVRYDVEGIFAQETDAPSKDRFVSDTDLAILQLSKPIPDIGVELGSRKDIRLGGIVVAYQPLAKKSELYHPDTYAELTPLSLRQSPVPAVCEFTGRQVKHREIIWDIPCGMIPGGSGGPVLVVKDGRLLLVGVVSSVNKSLSYNSIAPASLAAEMLLDPEKYYYSLLHGSRPLSGRYR